MIFFFFCNLNEEGRGWKKWHVCARAKLLRWYLNLYNPMDHSPPGSSVHEILQAEILEWVAIPCSRESSGPKDQTQVSYVSCLAGGFFLLLSHQQAFSLLQLAHSVPSLSSKLTEFCLSSKQGSPIHPLKPPGTSLSSYVESLKNACFAWKASANISVSCEEFSSPHQATWALKLTRTSGFS